MAPYQRGRHWKIYRPREGRAGAQVPQPIVDFEFQDEGGYDDGCSSGFSNGYNATPREKPDATMIRDSHYSDGSIGRPRPYSNTVDTIELDDFMQEFDCWCDLQRVKNGNFSPYMAWKDLVFHLKGSPRDEYHEFVRAHGPEIEAWKLCWSPTNVSMVFAATPNGRDSSSTGKELAVVEKVVPTFNPIVEFFEELRKSTGWLKLHKKKSLQQFKRSGESLREAYNRMRRLMTDTSSMAEWEAVQRWFSILDEDLQRGARFLAITKSTLKEAFEVTEQLEFTRMTMEIANARPIY